ncbi:MAG: hypothetical protein ABUR63_11040, partial [Verrucomicrobiota bacterium]
TSPRVSAGNGLFSLLGFMGLYALLSIAFVVIVTRVIAKGFDAPAAKSARPVDAHVGAIATTADAAE